MRGTEIPGAVVGVVELPGFARQDQPAHNTAGDELGANTAGAARATHPASGNRHRELLSQQTMGAGARLNRRR
jgi:hypothetical protein